MWSELKSYILVILLRLAGLFKADRLDHGWTSHFYNEIGFFQECFFMKCHFLCAYYLGFDWTDWVIFIKSEIIITAGKGLAGQFWQMESAPSLCNGVFTNQVIFSIILEHFFSDYGSTVPYACASIMRIITNKKSKGYQKIRNTLFLVSGFLKTDL